MNIRIFNKSNCKNSHTPIGVRSINVNGKDGVIKISQFLKEEIGLEVGQTVLLAQNEDKAEEWYIRFSDNDKDGFTLRIKKSVRKNKDLETLYFMNRIIARQLIASIKAEKTATLLISQKPIKVDGVDWYKIVTSKPLRIN